MINRKKLSRIILIALAVLAAMVLATAVFLQAGKFFGAFADGDVKDEYAERADNYYDGRFHNETESDSSQVDKTDPHKDRTTGKDAVPEGRLPMNEPSYENCPEDDVQITWYGHSTLLMQMHGMNILIDPVFSDYVGLNKAMGTPRFASITSYMKKLPHIDLCLLTHDHFDHLDYDAIMKLDSRIDAYIVPLGVDRRLAKFGISQDKITNIAWWEEQDVSGLTIACTPAQHSSGRILVDKKKTLWCSYVFQDKNHQIFLTGDSGYASHFKEIHKAYGDMDLVLTDGAQYGEEREQNINHMYPEESAKAAATMNADKVMLIHWGSFNLSDSHAWDDPPSRFAMACDEYGLDDITPKIGQTFRLSDTKELHEHWWEGIK